MSKMDGLRAMREARYQEAMSRSTKQKATVSEPGRRPPPRSAEARPSVAAEEAAAPALCGHRNISGRTCTRELGHTSKSHRYS